MEPVRHSAPEFDVVEVAIMKKLCGKHSIMYIANMLDRPFALVEKKVQELARKAGLQLYQPKRFERQLKNKEREQAWAAQQLQEKKIKIRQVDESQLISVRIDAKTIVRVRPDADIEAIKKKYKR